MKRKALLKHLRAHSCVLLREGGRHSVFQNSKTGKQSTVPRHNEIADLLARKICDQLEIERPS